MICTSSLRISNIVIGSLDLVCLLGIWIEFFPSTLWVASALGLPGGIPKYIKIPTFPVDFPFKLAFPVNFTPKLTFPVESPSN